MFVIGLTIAIQTSLVGAQKTATEVVIADIIIEIEGNKTSENALRRFLDIEKGDSFANESEMAAAVTRQQQDLVNERVFEEVRLSYEAVSGKDNHYAITVSVKDSWTFLPLPYVLYDSNTGLQMGVETTYDNAFGTMTNWYLDGYLTLGNNYENDSTLRGLEITPKLTDLKLGNLRYKIEYKQKYSTNQTGDPDAWTEYWTNHESYMTFGTSWEFIDDLFYSFYPGIGFKHDYDWKVIDPSASEENRYNLVWSHGVGPRRVDRLFNNLRQGYDVKLNNNLKAVGSSDPGSGDTAFRFVADVALDCRGYYLIGERINFYHRLYGLLVHDDVYRNLGSNLRGIRNSTMTGDMGVFQSNTFGIDVVHFKGVLDFQFHPFFDIGYAHGGASGTTGELRYGFGADFLIFIDKASNSTLRTTVGFDPTRDFDLELVIVTGYSY